mmetsp:Transcript_44961/g.104004  ORF Transcript_44961/g.104004 Transcript_44961/m.104004 type:complete len:114 (-) Transcript_44961:1029-1370(-)
MRDAQPRGKNLKSTLRCEGGAHLAAAPHVRQKQPIPEGYAPYPSSSPSSKALLNANRAQSTFRTFSKSPWTCCILGRTGCGSHRSPMRMLSEKADEMACTQAEIRRISSSSDC